MWNTTILLEESRRFHQNAFRLGVCGVTIFVRKIADPPSLVSKLIAHIANVVWMPTSFQYIQDLVFRNQPKVR